MELQKIIELLDEQAGLVTSSVTSSAVLKKFASWMIELSKYITDAEEQYTLHKVNTDNSITKKVLSLMREWWVKHRNKAQLLADTLYAEDLANTDKLFLIYKKAKMLYNSYDRLFQVGHSEYKFLWKDMAMANMHEQYSSFSTFDLEDEIPREM